MAPWERMAPWGNSAQHGRQHASSSLAYSIYQSLLFFGLFSRARALDNVFPTRKGCSNNNNNNVTACRAVILCLEMFLGVGLVCLFPRSTRASTR